MERTESREPRRVRRMFGEIAPSYDLLNHLLSANLDRRWRRAAARELAEGGFPRVLDLCGGTGDLTLELARPSGRTVVCCDFSHPMLRRAQTKFERADRPARCLTLEADGLRLPLAPAGFDAVTIAFGIRNFADMSEGLREIHRILRPAGRLIVLEFSRPTRPLLSTLYTFYLTKLLPRIGDRISGRQGAYSYLANTVSTFLSPEELADRIQESGFADCEWTPLTAGIVTIHRATKSGVQS